MEQHMIPFESLSFGKLLGRGQFGAVYRGTIGDASVAIKKITHPEEEFQWAEDMYLHREVEILHSLRHAHVLRFKGICASQGALYIITEFAEGGDLRQYLRKNSPTWEQRLIIAIQTAQAIDYLHSRNIVHRDIKTENVLMSKDLQVKICDFGFAREVDSKSPNNYTFCGSEFFEAPEIMFCMDYDERVDIFSYGLVLCELISRKQPNTVNFKRVNPGFGVAADEIRSLAEEGCPDPLLTIACECCSDEPDRRPELMLAITELKVSYRDLSGNDYQDVKTPEQLKMEEEENRRRQQLIEEAEEEERREQEEEERRARERDEHDKAQRVQEDTERLEKERLEQERAEREKAQKEREQREREEREKEEKEKEEREKKAGAEVEVEAKLVLNLQNSTLRVKNRQSLVKVNVQMFEKPSISSPSPMPTQADLLPGRSGSMDGRGSLERRRKDSKDDMAEKPEIIRIGRQLLGDKYVQVPKESHERWSRFVIGFMNAVPVSDRQIRVFGRIRIYRKCFTSEDVIESIYDLEPEIKTKKLAIELADLLVKLSFFFPIEGGTTFKERAMYRFHSDQAKFNEGSTKLKPAKSIKVKG